MRKSHSEGVRVLRRLLLHAAPAVIALAVVLPAAATANTSARASLNFSLGPTCAGGGSVTYTWSGFSGAKRVTVDVYDVDADAYAVNETVATHGSSGSVTYTFDETSGHNYTASGSLFKGKGPAPGSEQTEYGRAGCS
jgi:hypothetical protein